jgi:hypothetical protein
MAQDIREFELAVRKSRKASKRRNEREDCDSGK